MAGSGSTGADGPGRPDPQGRTSRRPVQASLFPPAVELGAGPSSASSVPDAAMAVHHRRVMWFCILILAWAAAVFLRLVDLQVVQRNKFEVLARSQQQRTVEVRASRGLILDRRGRELALSVPVDSICAMPAEITDPESVADILAPILRLPRAELNRKLSTGHGFVWIARLVEPEVSERVRALGLRGIYFQKESKRYYPKGSTAAHLIGAVGLDQVGLAGIEQSQEGELEGRPGARVITTDARQHNFADTLKQKADPGRNIQLTLDERIQFVAERELNAAIGRTDAIAGSVIVLRPSDGALLAVANYPTFDPNEPPRSTADLEHRRDFAVSSAFEPGSTFKLITISAALEEKLTRPSEVLDCQMGSILVAGHRIRDHRPFGLLTVEQVLAHSSDVCTIKLGLRLGDERMYEYIKRFGFGRPTGIELPGEARGLTRPPQRWSKISIGAISMGQEVGVTAVQLVQAVGAIANGGTLHQPHIIDSTFETGGPHVPVVHAPGRRVISPETAVEMKHMMEMVVLEGTGRLARLDGYTCGGKTGTAQKIDPKTRAYSKTNYVASFVGFAPLNNPAVVVAVILDSPRGLHQGGSVSAPVFRAVAEEVLRYLQVPQDLPSDPALRRKRVHPDAELLAEVNDFNPENGLTSDASSAREMEIAERPAPVSQMRVMRAAYGQSGYLAAGLARPSAERWSGSAPASGGVGGGREPAGVRGSAAGARGPGHAVAASVSAASWPGESAAPAPSPPRGSVLLAVTTGAMPDFSGKSLREVVEQATALGLAVDLRGSGVARRQSLPPGTPLHAGSRVAVEFER